MVINQPKFISEADYLAFERNANTKHEYANGTIVAMAGASFAHNLIVANLITALNVAQRDTDCFVLSSDLRIHIEKLQAYRYPDVTVVCEAPQFTDSQPQTLTNPSLLIEVLSKTTALIDRNAKLREYRQIPSLRAYWLVSQQIPRIETYTRQPNDMWLYMDVEGIGKMIELPMLAMALSLADIYRQITFTKDADE